MAAQFSCFSFVCFCICAFGFSQGRDHGRRGPDDGQFGPLGRGGPPFGGPADGSTQDDGSWIKEAATSSSSSSSSGVSASTAGNNYCSATVPAMEGPYYKANAPMRSEPSVCDWQNTRNGTQLMVRGKVYSAGCVSEIRAVLDIWHANPQGQYSSKDGPDYSCRGKVATDANGNYQYLTVIPGHYTGRAAHIHYKIGAASQQSKVLTTQMFFQGDPAIATDFCQTGCGVGDPTTTFPLQPPTQPGKSYMITFNIVLS